MRPAPRFAFLYHDVDLIEVVCSIVFRRILDYWQATMAESVDSILRAQYDLSERERCRDCVGGIQLPSSVRSNCHELSCWQAKTSSRGHAGWSLKSGGCSDCAFPFFLSKRPFLIMNLEMTQDAIIWITSSKVLPTTIRISFLVYLPKPWPSTLWIEWVWPGEGFVDQTACGLAYLDHAGEIRLVSRKTFLFGVWVLLDVSDVEEMGHIQAFSVLGVDDSMVWAWVAEKLCVEHPVCVAELADLKSPTCSEVHGVALNIDRCQV